MPAAMGNKGRAKDEECADRRQDKPQRADRMPAVPRVLERVNDAGDECCGNQGEVQYPAPFRVARAPKKQAEDRPCQYQARKKVRPHQEPGGEIRPLDFSGVVVGDVTEERGG